MLDASKNGSTLDSEKERAPSPIPTAASSLCSSEHSIGETSPTNSSNSVEAPSRTCDQRNLSAAVVSKPGVEHKLLQGRPRFALPRVGGNRAANRAAARTPPPPVQAQDPFVPVAFDYVLDPPALRMDAWTEAMAPEFNVRTQTYMRDQKKAPSLPSVFKLLTIDLVKVDKPIYSGLCSHPEERIQKALRREKETGVRELPEFIYAVNLTIPGKSTFHWVAYFGVDDTSVLRDQNTPFGRIAEPFFFGDSDEYRNKTFKLIPRIKEGNFVVRKAVGSKPSILGSKLKQYYTRTDRFFEMVIDIGSNKVAQKIVKVAQGCAKNLVVDMMFVLEGADEETLPERIMGGARLSNLDFRQKDGQRLCRQPA
jgi:hypothetical protein